MSFTDPAGQHLLQALAHGDETEGGLAIPPNSKSGHIESVAKGWQNLRKRTGISSSIVPYSARHTYRSYTMEATGNIFAVAGSMGYVDIKSMEPYQHHGIDTLREAIDRRNEANAN